MRSRIRINGLIQIFCHQRRFITAVKPQNTDQNVIIDASFKQQQSKRRTIGHNSNAITPAKGGKQFIKYRKQILNCNSINEIDSILKSNHNFDIKIYTAAIKRAGMLKDAMYCKTIMQLALQNPKVIPDLALYGTLFHTFNLNNNSFYSDDYLKQMINVYNLKPNIIVATTLLGGCTKNGNVKKANSIWKDIILKYNLIPNKLTFMELIQTYGQNGDYMKAKYWYDQMIENGIESDSYAKGALMKAYIDNHRIDEALEIKNEMDKNGETLTVPAYMPLIYFYLKEECLNEKYALELLDECKEKCKLMTSTYCAIKAVANLKLLQRETDIDCRKIYFDIIKECGESNTHKNAKLASTLLEAYLEYYDCNFNDKEVIRCFETFCKEKLIGYWSYDKIINKWVINLHGYSYNAVQFVLYYVLKYKVNELINEMKYEWIIVCGKGYHTDPMSKELKMGIKQFLIDILQRDYDIEACIDGDNCGRVKLNVEHVKRFIHLNSK